MGLGVGGAVGTADGAPSIAEFSGMSGCGRSRSAVWFGGRSGYPGITLPGLIGPPSRLTTTTIAYPTQAAPTP